MTRKSPATSVPRAGTSAPLLLPALLLAFAFAGVAPRAAAQCSMCKDAVYTQSDPSRNNALGAAFNDSIYLMLAVPGLLIGGLALLIALNVRARARHEAAAAATSTDAAPPPVVPPPEG